MSTDRSEPHVNSGSDPQDTDDTSVSSADSNFKPLFEKLSQQSIEQFALDYRNARNHLEPSGERCEPVAEGPTLEDHIVSVEVNKPICGSYNAVYCLNYSENLRWALKIPKNGYEGSWNLQEADDFAKRVHLLRFLKRETSIPVPVVIDYNATLDNSLGFPFVLMEWISGHSASEIWRDMSCSESQLRERRVRLIRDLASAMKQLERFQFDSIGAPDMTYSDRPRSIGSFKADEFVFGDDNFWSSKEVTVGPYRDQKAFFSEMLTRNRKPLNGFDKWIELFIQWAVENCHQERFALTHRDLHLSNLIVDERGHLLGVLDWDLALAAPKCVGNASYPVWLNFDLTKDSDFDDECDGGDHSPSGSKTKYLHSISLGYSALHHEHDYYRAVWRHCIGLLYSNNDGNQGLSSSEHEHDQLKVERILTAIPRTYEEGLSEQSSLGMAGIHNLANCKFLSYAGSSHILSKISMLERKRPWLKHKTSNRYEDCDDGLGLSKDLNETSLDDNMTAKFVPDHMSNDGVKDEEVFPSSSSLVALLEIGLLNEVTLAKVKEWFLYLLYLP